MAADRHRSSWSVPMDNNSPPATGWYRRFSTAAARWFIRVARSPYAVLPFAILAITDSVLPLLPAELMVITLMIMQPRFRPAIVAGFALASAASAVLLALLVQEASTYVLELNPGLAEGLEKASPLIVDGGAVALAVLSVFPDSPRASIAAAASLGVSPTSIFVAVLVGKLMLYLGLSFLLRRLPQLTPWLKGSRSTIVSKVRPMLRRLAALQRLLGKDNR